MIAKWTANANYPFGSLIVDSNNNVQMALYNGVTANTSNPPNWPTTLGALTGDNTQIWKLIALGYQNTYWVATGYVFNLLNAPSSYRVDVFVHTDVWYYQGSSGLQTTVPPGSGAYAGGYTWSLAGVRPGLLLAALYPTSVAPPASGWYGPAIPSGWVAHTNTGVCQTPQAGTTLGGKLTNYKAQIYVKTDIEYLLEDNIPIIVQSDGFHARAGSSVMATPGTRGRPYPLQRPGGGMDGSFRFPGIGAGVFGPAALVRRSHQRSAFRSRSRRRRTSPRCRIAGTSTIPPWPFWPIPPRGISPRRKRSSIN